MQLIAIEVDSDCSIVTIAEQRCPQDMSLDERPDTCVIVFQTYLSVRIGASRACESPIDCDGPARSFCQQYGAENGKEYDQHIDEEVVADLVDASQTVGVG